MQSHWGLELQHVNLEEENTLRPQPQYPIRPFPLMTETGKKMNPIYGAWKRERRVCWQMQWSHWPAPWPCEEHRLPLLCGTAREAETIATLHKVPSTDPDTHRHCALCLPSLFSLPPYQSAWTRPLSQGLAQTSSTSWFRSEAWSFYFTTRREHPWFSCMQTWVALGTRWGHLVQGGAIMSQRELGWGQHQKPSNLKQNRGAVLRTWEQVNSYSV